MFSAHQWISCQVLILLTGVRKLIRSLVTEEGKVSWACLSSVTQMLRDDLCRSVFYLDSWLKAHVGCGAGHLSSSGEGGKAERWMWASSNTLLEYGCYSRDFVLEPALKLSTRVCWKSYTKKEEQGTSGSWDDSLWVDIILGTFAAAVPVNLQGSSSHSESTAQLLP